MKVWIVVAIWVWWTTMVGAALVVEQHTLNYGVVKFTTDGATKNSYKEFIEALRDQLATRDERRTIPVLRDPSTVPDSQRFVLVELSNSAEVSITLAIDVTNVYVVAYQAGDQSNFFPDAPSTAFSNLFPGTRNRTLRFNSTYPELQRTAGSNRENIDLGIPALAEAISWLRSTSSQDSTLARSLLVSIQMVSEAARFPYIVQRVGVHIHERFRPDAAVLSFQNNWGALSSLMQGQTSSVRLQRSNYSFFDVERTNPALKPNLALLLFICRDLASQFSLLIRSVVAVDDDTCVHPEPTVRISGRNGLCVDVRDGKYNNGNPIQLWTCNETSTVNQLWTLKRDGTIRSNGTCLTTNGYSPRSYVMIYDCPNPVTDSTLWEVWDNGTIINPQSKLVLSAESGNRGTELTMQTNIYASRQGWLAGNNSEPFVTSIVGYMDLCMQANGEAMWLEECESSKAEQKWALYADGSIRPDQNRDSCLTNNSQDHIIISSCSPASESQRWVFRNDGTILNLNKGMVMDVKQSDPSLHQIILYAFTGNPSQKWLPII